MTAGVSPTPHAAAEASSLVRALRWLLMLPVRALEELGILGTLLGHAIRWGLRPPFRPRVFLSAMDFVGVGSVFIVALTSVFVGGVFGIQLVYGFRQFGAEDQTGSVIGLALARELAPVFAALMVSARAGSAMTTELGSMRVTNQIDALTAMAVSPIQYLVVPRLFAGTLMVPVLTMLFNLVGLGGAWFVCTDLLGLDSGIFLDKVAWYVDASDVKQGLIKAAFFGLTVALIACRQGFFASGGAAGVGHATNRSVVQSAVAVLILDYFITTLVTGEGGFL